MGKKSNWALHLNVQSVYVKRGSEFERSAGSLPTCCRGFGDLKKNRACLHVSDFEPGEVDLVYVLLWTTEVIYGSKNKPGCASFWTLIKSSFVR